MWLLLMFLASNAVRFRVSGLGAIVDQQRRRTHHREGGPRSRSGAHVEMMDESLGPLDLDGDSQDDESHDDDGDSGQGYTDEEDDNDELGEFEENSEPDLDEDESEEPDVRTAGEGRVGGSRVWANASASRAVLVQREGDAQQRPTTSGESLSLTGRPQQRHQQQQQRQPTMLGAAAVRLATAASGSLLGMLGVLENRNVAQLRREDMHQLQQRRDALQQQVLQLEEQQQLEDREQQQLRQSELQQQAPSEHLQTAAAKRHATATTTSHADDEAGPSSRPSLPRPTTRSLTATAGALNLRPLTPRQQPSRNPPSQSTVPVHGRLSVPALTSAQQLQQQQEGGRWEICRDGSLYLAPATTRPLPGATSGLRIVLQREPSTWSGGAAQAMTRRVSRAISSARTHGACGFWAGAFPLWRDLQTNVHQSLDARLVIESVHVSLFVLSMLQTILPSPCSLY